MPFVCKENEKGAESKMERQRSDEEEAVFE